MEYFEGKAKGEISVPWVTPVFDRTQDDVDEAIQTLAVWRLLAEPGVFVRTSDLKGCFSYTDLNRIEGNLKYLQEVANRIRPGPPLATPTKTDWTQNDIPTTADLRRIIQGIAALEERVHKSGAVVLPSTILTYQDANAVEEALAWCDSHLERIGTWLRASDFTWGDMRSLTWGNLS